MDPGVIVAVLAAVFAPLATYVISARRFSGKVATTDAARLWDASETMRKELASRNDYLRTVVDGLEAKVTGLENRLMALEERERALQRENDDLKSTLREQERTIAELRRQVTDLTAENVGLRKTNVSMKRRLARLENNV